ncbi:unnamed protein product [Echinostoma caproni]|uniref:P-type Cu(+) transporter n=1 Tax=Echinostoma caproni TaxID=27848 RepID=A0A183B1N5_9TREM|nr:unnamed protein product [Echinostoma caproni]
MDVQVEPQSVPLVGARPLDKESVPTSTNQPLVIIPLDCDPDESLDMNEASYMQDNYITPNRPRSSTGTRVKDSSQSSLARCFLRITGMTCSSCVHLIEQNLMKMPVALIAMKGEVCYDPQLVNPNQIAYRVTELGFEAEIIEQNDCLKGETRAKLLLTSEADLVAAASRMRLDYIACLWPQRPSKVLNEADKSELLLTSSTAPTDLLSESIRSTDQPPYEYDIMRSTFTDIPFDWADVSKGGSFVVHIGSREWLNQNRIALPMLVSPIFSEHGRPSCTSTDQLPTLESLIAADEARGQTVVLVAVDHHLIGLVSVEDPVKPEAALAVAALRHRGIRVGLLTGDNCRTATAIARQVGIRDVYADVLPAHKAAEVKRLQRSARPKKRRQIQPAPSDFVQQQSCKQQLTAASMIEDIDVIGAIDLSKATVRRIRCNFVAATLYNMIGIPIAAGCLLPLGIELAPWMASAAMAASSVSVICLSLLLRRWKRPTEASLVCPEYVRLLTNSGLDSTKVSITDQYCPIKY